MKRLIASLLSAAILLPAPALAAEIVGPKAEMPALTPIAPVLPSAVPTLNPLPQLASIQAPETSIPQAATPEVAAAPQALAATQALSAQLAAVQPQAAGATAQSETILRQAMDGAKSAGANAERTGLVCAAAGVTVVGVAKAVGVIAASKAAVFGLLPAALYLGGRALSRRAAAKLQDAASGPLSDRAAGFKSLFEGETAALTGSRLMRWAAFATMDGAGMLALHHFKADPGAGALFVAAAVAGYYALRQTKAYDKAVRLARVALYGRLREGKEQRPLDSIPGATGLEKHVGYFAGGDIRVRFWHTFQNLRASGEAAHTAIVTALAAHITMSSKTQAGLTSEQKKELGLRRFDIYRPNIGRALMPSDSGAFATNNKADGTKRGDVDMEKFERIFRDFAGGRDYVTAKDLARLEKANYERDKGKVPFLKGLIGKIQSKRSFDQMLSQLADRVVLEEGKLVPAISKPQLLWLYQGRSMYDLMQERTGKDPLKRPGS